MILAYRYRVKGKTGELKRQARAVNYVWNFANESQRSCLRIGKKWLTGYDLDALTVGTSKEFGLQSGTIDAVCHEYAKSRRQHKRPYLRFRGRKSLGWVPIKGREIKQTVKGFRFNKKDYRVFMSRPLPIGKIRDGSSFSQDARGRWYLNLIVDIQDSPKRMVRRLVGIDLGLKDLAALSTGQKVEAPQNYRRLEPRLAVAQRSGKKRAVAAIRAKAANCRRDFLHKASTQIVRDFDSIAVGNVSPSKLAKTKMAKSVLDAGWSSFRSMLMYKSIMNGVSYAEVNENHSTQVCSKCGCLGGPGGLEDLEIRTWTCAECGETHDRDVNAARNILFGSGHRTLAVGAST